MRAKRILVALGLLIVVLIGILTFLAYRNNVPFNQTQWLRTEPTITNSNLREQMINSLLRDYHLLGKSREEIYSLLGPPTGTDQKNATSTFFPAYLAQAPTFSYVIGMNLIDRKYFRLYFDAQGKVAKWDFWQDP